MPGMLGLVLNALCIDVLGDAGLWESDHYQVRENMNMFWQRFLESLN